MSIIASMANRGPPVVEGICDNNECVSEERSKTATSHSKTGHVFSATGADERGGAEVVFIARLTSKDCRKPGFRNSQQF